MCEEMLKGKLRITNINGSSKLANNLIVTLIILLTTGFVGFAQQERRPDRGYQAGNSYSISDIESINLTNGNLLLNVPLASLPAGRGTTPGYGVSLAYNSKLWNAKRELREDGTPDETGNRNYSRELLEPTNEGGWRINASYNLKITNRTNLAALEKCEPFNNDYPKNGYAWQVGIQLPDGSVKNFRPYGSGSYFEDYFKDGFFEVDPNGQIQRYSISTIVNDPDRGTFAQCSITPITVTTTGMNYYSTDGSGVRLFIPYAAGAPSTDGNRRWQMYYPNGTTVENLPPDDPSIYQRTTDRNGNQVVVKPGSFNGLQGTKIEDQAGRFIFIASDANNDTKIYQSGGNGEQLETTVKWKNYWVYRSYKATDALNAPANLQNAEVFTSFSGVDKIVLPTQASSLTYDFAYNATVVQPSSGNYTPGWGELKSVTLPSKARADYTYQMDGNTAALSNTEILNNSVSQKELKYDAVYDGQTTPKTDIWQYGAGYSGGSVTAPDGGVTYQSSFYNTNTWQDGLIYKISSPDGSVTERIWEQKGSRLGTPGQAINPYIKTEFTSIPGASGQLTLTAIKDYVYDQNSNVREVREYDWAAYDAVPRSNYKPTGIPSGATLKRVTVNEYYNSTPLSSDSATNTNYYANPSSPKLLNLIKSAETRNATETPVSRSEFYYDDPGNKGNLVETRIWDSTKAATLPSPDANGYRLNSNNFILTSTTYDAYGNPLSTTDARGVATAITYGCINGQTSCQPTEQNLYPTKTEAASNYAGLKRTSTAEYDFYTGSVTKTTDVDNNVSSATVYDALGRPTVSKAAVGTPLEVWTQSSYDDVARTVIVKSDLFVKGDGKKVGVQHYDQLGRVFLTRTLEDSATQSATNINDGIKIQTRYLTGNPYSYQLTSNPYRATTASGATNEPSMGWTLSKTINTGKFSEVQSFSGAELPAAFGGSNANSSGIVRTDIDADRILVTDQAGKRRISKTNALGQLIDVWEVKEVDTDTEAITFGNPAVSLNGLKTSYEYDTLNNLTKVIQGTQTNRNFSYSSLSRLLTAQNPESGTIGYLYDNNGSLTKKTDARLVETNYLYDALNRVTNRSYAAPAGLANYQASLPVSYTYDNVANAKGRLTKVVTGTGATPFSVTEYTSFDIMGRVTGHKQTTDGTDYATAYVYNLSGAMIEETYPSTRKVKNVLDNDGDLAVVQSKKTASAAYWDYAQNFTYTAAGAVSSMQLGNSKWESAVFNSRLQPTQIALGTLQNGTDKLKLNFAYNTTGQNDNNGNVLSQTITVPTETRNNQTYSAFTATQTYTYDALNRIKDAVEMNGATQTWKQTFQYDRYGNRTFDTAAGKTTTIPAGCPQAVCNPSADTANNKLVGYTYDSAGNTKIDAESRAFTYDGENKQTEVKDAYGNVIGQYFYDGDGKRVKKYVPSTGETTIFVYDASGKMVAEYSTVVATQADAKVSYLTSDHLGSPRINTDKYGDVISRHDYQPFGEEIARASYGADTVKQKFTSYERDFETGLDYAKARMFGSSFGRFTSPDPIAGKILLPQSHNKYVYVENNPLKYIDPTGETLVINGNNAGDLISELEQSTGYKLSRCTEVNKKAGCNQIGQVLIAGTADSKGSSKKLGSLLKNVIENLKDGKGNDVTVTLNTTKNDSRNFIDRFSSRTVDVGDLQKLRGIGAGNFVAGQLGHVLAEYSGAAVNQANNSNYTDTDEDGNPRTHGAGLTMESLIMSELDGETYSPRRGGYLPDLAQGQRESVYIYDGEKNKVGYIFRFEVDSNKRFILNVTKNVELNVIPKNPKNTQVPR